MTSPAWGATSPCRLTELSPNPSATDNEEDYLSPSKDGSGSYILASPSPCERSYIIARSRDEGKNRQYGSNVFSPIQMQEETSPTLSPSPSRSAPDFSDTPD